MPKQRIPSLISVEECLDYAVECEECAEGTTDEASRRRLAEIARTWRDLAAEITLSHRLH